jgi:hypothetical protein
MSKLKLCAVALLFSFSLAPISAMRVTTVGNKCPCRAIKGKKHNGVYKTLKGKTLKGKTLKGKTIPSALHSQ